MKSKIESERTHAHRVRVRVSRAPVGEARRVRNGPRSLPHLVLSQRAPPTDPVSPSSSLLLVFVVALASPDTPPHIVHASHDSIMDGWNKLQSSFAGLNLGQSANKFAKGFQSSVQATKERLGQVSADEITELPQGMYHLSAP